MTDTVLYAQMAREPIPGRVKTRLLSVLTPDLAAELHRAMVEHCCRVLCETTNSLQDNAQDSSQNKAQNKAQNNSQNKVQLWVDGDPAAFADCESQGASIRAQPAGDLGERMARVFESGLAEHKAVVLVGSDCPFISGDYLRTAATALQAHDAVLGPALDGGYVLIGLKRFTPELFTGMDWGGASVLQDTCTVLDRLGWTYSLLEPLRDIDRPEDLHVLPPLLKNLLN